MKRIYMDYAATTPVDPQVVKEMEPYFNQKFGNTMSIHTSGRAAKAAIEDAREKVASLMKADPKELIFTGSASESNNFALK
jgi:cysteine desulfurase